MSGPDETRDYFPEAKVIVLPKFEPIVGPLTPAPQRSLADTIGQMVAADERWYALNDGWVA